MMTSVWLLMEAVITPVLTLWGPLCVPVIQAGTYSQTAPPVQVCIKLEILISLYRFIII